MAAAFQGRDDEPILVERLEAVQLSGCCANSFDKHIRPRLSERRIGRKVMFVRGELIQWLESGVEASA